MLVHNTTVEFNGKVYDQIHGGLFDRGSADSYYGRSRSPHWYPAGTGNGQRVTDLTPPEVAEYNAGYDWNEQFGDKKCWV
jgi:hypothetical protein